MTGPVHQRRRLSRWNYAASVSSSQLQINQKAILKSPRRKEEELPYTPRTYEKVKDRVNAAETALDDFFTDRAERRRAEREEIRELVLLESPKKPALELALEKPSPERSPPKKPAPAKPTAAQRLQMKIDAARAESENTETPASSAGHAKVPLMKTRTGEVCLDIKALQRMASDCPRGLGAASGNPLSREEISRACDRKAAKALRRCSSVPNYVLENRRSSSLKCLRPESRHRARAKQMSRTNSRLELVMSRKRMALEELCERALNASRPQQQVVATPGSDPATPAPATSTKINKRSGRLAAQPEVRSPQPWFAAEGARLGLRWAASEAALGTMFRMLGNSRRAKADKQWEVAAKLVRCVRFFKRLKARREAATVVRQVLLQVPFGYKLRALYNRQKTAVLHIQRAWRHFSSHINLKVLNLLDGPWMAQELFLLEAIFTECPTEGEVRVGNAALMTREAILQDENEPFMRSDKAEAGTSPKRRRPPALGVSQAFSNTQNLANIQPTFHTPVSSHQPREPPTSASKLSAGSRPQSRPASAGRTPSSAMGRPASAGRLPSSALGRPTSAMKIKFRGRDADSERFEKELQELVDGAMRRRMQKRVHEHHAQRAVAWKILRWELLERRYDYRARLEQQKQQAIILERQRTKRPPQDSFAEIFEEADNLDREPSATESGTAVDIGCAADAEHLTAREVADLVHCFHFGSGVRPSRPEVCSIFFQCDDIKVSMMSQMLMGGLAMREAMQYREAVRLGRPRSAMLFHSQTRSRRQSLRPASAPLQRRLDPDFADAKKEVEAPTLATRAKSFDACFAQAETFAKKTLAPVVIDQAPDGAICIGDAEQMGFRNLIPPGLSTMEVGSLPGLHAAGVDFDSDKKTQLLQQSASAPALPNAGSDGAGRRSQRQGSKSRAASKVWR